MQINRFSWDVGTAPVAEWSRVLKTKGFTKNSQHLGFYEERTNSNLASKFSGSHGMKEMPQWLTGLGY